MLNTALQIVGTEWIWIVFLVIFLLFGSKKLPELSRALGKAMGEFQRGREEIEREFRAATTTSYVPPKIERREMRQEKTAEEKASADAPVQAKPPAKAAEGEGASGKPAEEKEKA